MNSIMCFFIISLLMCFLIMIMLLMLSKKSLVDLQKSSPFECGFNPISSKRLPFSIHFFLIAVLFLIFDIEIIIILPLVITVNYGFIISWLMSSILFILILILGLYYEWRDGMLNWSN